MPLIKLWLGFRSVPIEHLDDNGEKVIDESIKKVGNEEVGGLINHKR